jgi:lysophospholipase L1-like esterase/poly(3-hydroxybutyrate) depolymerase
MSPAQIKVACIGNSITEGTGLSNPSTLAYPARLAALLGGNYTVQNDGVSGTTLLKNGDNPYWTRGKLSNALAFKPNIVTIKLGTNDTKSQNWDAHKDEFKRDYLALIDTLNALSTKPRIFLVLPVPIWSNGYGIRDSALKKIIVILKQIADERGLPVIDCNTPLLSAQSFFGDGVHPNATGADSIARIIYRSITGSPEVRFQFRSFTSSGTSLPYRLFVPENYSRQQMYPLILTLHGVGESGTDNIAHVKKNRVAERWAEDSTQNVQKCFVVSPQCPTSDKWVNVPAWTNIYYSTQTLQESASLGSALKLVDSLVKEFPIDTNRLYITGLSMGGYGTWDVLARHPGKFAAAIALCGGSDTSKANQIKNTPVWTFHGAIDNVVPPMATRSMIARFEALGTSVVKYTAQYANYFSGSTITREKLTSKIDSGATTIFCEYPDADHSIWTNTYNEPLLTRWLFKQKKQPPVSVLSAAPARAASAIDGLIAIYPGNRLSGLAEKDLSKGRYEVRIFDLKGTLLNRTILNGGSNARQTIQGMIRSVSGIQWMSLRQIKE